jgi:hypothetical protein
MNFTKLTTTTIIALSLALPAGAAFSQERTVDPNLNQAQQDINNAGENLKDAGRNTGAAAERGLNNAGNAIERNYNQAQQQIGQSANQAEREINRATEAGEAQIAETAAELEQRANWGWLGLLGLIGLFGLAGRNKKEVVVKRRGLDPLDPGDRPTTYNH